MRKNIVVFQMVCHRLAVCCAKIVLFVRFERVSNILDVDVFRQSRKGLSLVP